MEDYKQIAEEAGVSIEGVRELMAHACVKRTYRSSRVEEV